MPREPVSAPPLCSEMRAVKSLRLPGARVLASVKWGDHLHVAGVTAEDSSHNACRRQCATQTRGLHLEMPHRHPGRPGREAAGCGAAANSTGRLSGPAGSKAPSARHSGRAGGVGVGGRARPRNPSRHDRRVSDLNSPPSEGTAAPRGRRDVVPGRPKGAASAGSRAQRPSPSTRHPPPPAAGPRHADAVAFPAAPRPLRPVSPAAPGHAAPRAGAGS